MSCLVVKKLHGTAVTSTYTSIMSSKTSVFNRSRSPLDAASIILLMLDSKGAAIVAKSDRLARLASVASRFCMLDPVFLGGWRGYA
eukprot:3213-Heterococcus_DN1.PRE.2